MSKRDNLSSCLARGEYTSPEQHRDFESAYATFLRHIDSLEAFRIAAQSKFGAGGHRAAFRITDERTAALITAMGSLARQQRLVAVALGVLRSVNPHAARREWEGQLFSSASAVLVGSCVDVDRATGPEPSRWSDARSPYTRGEKLLVLETLFAQCDGWIGPGWAAQRLAAQEGVSLPEFHRG